MKGILTLSLFMGFKHVTMLNTLTSKWSYSLLSTNLFALPLGANGFDFHSLWSDPRVISSYLAQLYSFDLAWFYQSRLFHSWNWDHLNHNLFPSRLMKD